MSEFVTLAGVSKSFGSQRAVEDLSLSIPRGIVFGLLGPNGAGKTTTISMLSGLIPPDSGDIVIGGHSIRAEPLECKALMGVVPQEIALYTTLTGWENLRFWGQIYGLRGNDLRTRSAEILEMVGLTDRAGDAVRTYSGGMKRRLNIAVGLLHRPSLLLLDEPTVGVDPQSRRAILDTIKDLNSGGMTVLYTSHYMEEVSEMCDLVAIMDRGRIMAVGTQAELHRLVGDRTVVRLDIDSDLEDVSFLRDLDLVDAVDIDGRRISVTTADGNAALPSLIGALTAGGRSVVGVRVEQPNLEAVFLHMTGRTLRD